MNEVEKDCIDLQSEEDFYLKVLCKKLVRPRNGRDWFRRNGIKNAADILCYDTTSLLSFPAHKMLEVADVLRCLSEYGYRRNDCGFEKYPQIDTYFREHFRCRWCGSSLDNEANTMLLLCRKCFCRRERVYSEKTLYVELSQVDSEEDEENIPGIIVDITVQNNSSSPLLIALNSLVLHTYYQRIQSDYDSVEYEFDEDYIIPGERIVIRKAFTNVEKLGIQDYFIVSFTDKTSRKQHIYKFARQHNDNDYWEVDLTNQDIAELPSIKKAIENMLALEIPIEYIQDFRSYGTIYLINGRTADSINCHTHPDLYSFIETLEKNESVVYAVFNEPNIYGEKTDRYALLCINADNINSPQYQLCKKGTLCKTVAYTWCSSNGIVEPSIACFQIVNGGVWYLPYPITRMISSKFD